MTLSLLVRARYRDFGDRKQYEGPFDFHTEAELSVLLDKLKNIKAYGGDNRSARQTAVPSPRHRLCKVDNNA